jgi:hypothetical protein
MSHPTHDKELLMKSRALGFVLLLFVCSVASAQEPADNPIVGRFAESELWYQEISRFGEYEIAVAGEETQTIQGEVWMTLYDAPADSSTFSVYSTYMSFLEDQGFEILVSYKPGDCPPDFLSAVYFRAPFADNGNYGHPAPFTNDSNDQAAYISARRGDGIYVSVAIAAGWESYPQYKLDVVEIKRNTQRITVQAAGAADEAGDNAIVGRFNRSEIVHQEVSRFGEYEIATGDEETQKIQGEVWMTLYDAPDDSSTFSVYATYLSFLQEQGFEILQSYKPRECPGGLLADVYNRAPFADNGNYGHPAPFTNGNEAHSAYIAARRGDSLYVSIAIAAGWESYPQYKLDVVEVKSNTGGIASIGTPAEPETEDASERAVNEAPGGEVTATNGAAEPAREAEPARDADAAAGGARGRTGFFTGNGSFEVRGGMAGYLFLDPAIAGGLVVTDTGGVPVVQSEGFKNLYGPWGRATWFPNESLGIGFEGAYIRSMEDFSADGTTYISEAELQLFQAAAVARMVGSEYPATITMAFTGGAAIITLEQSVDGSGADYYRSVEDTLGVFGTSIDLSIPIVRFGHLTAGMAYLFIPFSELTMRDEDETYARTYYEGNLGGLELRLGIVLEI